MKAFVAVLFVVAAANAGLIAPAVIPSTVIARAPALDSAVIKSDRLGGNFAYSVSEAHAYTATSPVVQHVATPVAVSYSAPAIQQVVAAPQVYAAQHQYIASPQVYAAPHHVIGAPAVVSNIGVPAATVRIA